MAIPNRDTMMSESRSVEQWLTLVIAMFGTVRPAAKFSVEVAGMACGDEPSNTVMCPWRVGATTVTLSATAWTRALNSSSSSNVKVVHRYCCGPSGRRSRVRARVEEAGGAGQLVRAEIGGGRCRRAGGGVVVADDVGDGVGQARGVVDADLATGVHRHGDEVGPGPAGVEVDRGRGRARLRRGVHGEVAAAGRGDGGEVEDDRRDAGSGRNARRGRATNRSMLLAAPIGVVVLTPVLRRVSSKRAGASGV